MDESREDRIEDIAQRAARLIGQERRNFLAHACGDDADLRKQVEESILEIEEDAADPGFWRAPTLVEERDDDAESEFSVGFRIGDFEILRQLGRGGMRATVYLARQISLQREVALKVLVEGDITSERDIERFHRSAVAAAKLHHPGIVQVFTHGTEGKAHYLAMEYVAGHDLGHEIAQQEERSRRAAAPAPALLLPPRTSREFLPAALRLCRDVAHALQHAHDLRIVHRDVKPQNLMLDRAGKVRVVDFGLARDSSVERTPPRLTKSGAILGTVAYMSPEQARAARHVVDHRTDIYSLGAVLYELLSGRQPFRGDSEVEVLSAIVAQDPPPLRSLAPGVPSDVAAICGMAMAKAPTERYRSAADFADDLACVLDIRHPLHARVPTVAQNVHRWLRRRRRLLTTATVVVVGMALSASWVAHASEIGKRELLVASLKPVFDTKNLDALPFAAIYGAKSALANLRADVGLNSQQEAVAGGVEQQLEQYYQGSVTAAEGDLRMGLGNGRDSHPGAVRVDLIVRGANRLRDAARLFPERPTIALDAQPLLPSVSVRVRDERGNVLGGHVAYRYLDQVTGVPGPRVDLGALPGAEHRVQPGFARILVAIDGHGIREFTRTLWQPTSAVVIDYVVRPEQTTTERMVRFEAAPPRANDTKGPYAGQPVEGFWLDETEVTLGDYRRFLRSTRRQDPFATLGEPPTRYDDLPAAFVSWDNAVAYAEWVGKRLPSVAEWDWAARGINGRLFPYTDQRQGVDYLGNSSVPRASEVIADKLALFLREAKPVRAYPAANTPDGVFELLGSVGEWTESMAAERVDGEGWRPLPSMRWWKGGTWHAKANGATLRADGIDGTTDDFSIYIRGFRCARSIPP